MEKNGVELSRFVITFFNKYVHYDPACKHPLAYKHMCLYPGHKHMCLYPVDIYQSVTKSLRFRITVIPLILSQITVAQATFFIKWRLLFPKRVWNAEYWAKFTEMIKKLDIKFKYFCLV